MYIKKSTLNLYISIFSICLIILAGCLLITKTVLQGKEETTIAQREALLYEGKKYIIDNVTYYINLETLYNSGYVNQNISDTCDKRNSTIEYKNKHFIINLICNNKIETLTISN